MARYITARLEDSEEAMNKFAITTAKSPTIKDEVELLLLTLFFDNPNSDILGGHASLRFRADC